MILILAQERDPSVPMVEAHLKGKGASWFRFDPGMFPSQGRLSCKYDGCGVASRWLHFNGKSIELSSLTSIWYRHPARPVAPENLRDEQMKKWVEKESLTFIKGLWLSLDSFWVSEPQRILDAQNKTYHLEVAAKTGFRIPATLMTNDPEEFLRFYAECGGSVISKPSLYGDVTYGGKIYYAYTNLIKSHDLGFFRSIRYAPVVFQEYIPKKVELRVTVVGEEVFAAEIHSQRSPRSKVDWRRYDLENTPYYIHDLPRGIARNCIRLVKTLGLRYGALDFILTPRGEYVFLELNPNGQWGWVEALTGMPISKAIADLLINGAAKTEVSS